MLNAKTRQKGKYKAVIIGAGKIATQFDSPKSKKVLTHAHAYYKHPKVDLIGFYDINKPTASRAAKKWHCRVFFDFKKMLDNVKPDIISICTPDENHFDTLLKISKYKPRIVICEKPITTNLKDTQKIVNLYKKIRIPVLVNYSRRFDKTVQTVKKNIAQGKYGKVLCASGIYTKGIVHNGSHMIDLGRFLFGEVKKSLVLHTVSGSIKNDKNIAGFLEFKICKQFHLMAGDEKKFSIFELDIILEKKRVKFFDFGLQISLQNVEKDPLYKGYKSLGKPTIIKTAFMDALPELIENAINSIEKNKPLRCSLEDAFKTQKACFSLLNK